MAARQHLPAMHSWPEGWMMFLVNHVWFAASCTAKLMSRCATRKRAALMSPSKLHLQIVFCKASDGCNPTKCALQGSTTSLGLPLAEPVKHCKRQSYGQALTWHSCMLNLTQRTKNQQARRVSVNLTTHPYASPCMSLGTQANLYKGNQSASVRNPSVLWFVQHGR